MSITTKNCQDLVLEDLTVKGLKQRYLKRALKKKKLTRRELEVVSQLLEGKFNREIADSMYITEKTVKFHFTNVLKKLKVKHRVSLIVTVTDLLLNKLRIGDLRSSTGKKPNSNLPKGSVKFGGKPMKLKNYENFGLNTKRG